RPFISRRFERRTLGGCGRRFGRIAFVFVLLAAAHAKNERETQNQPKHCPLRKHDSVSPYLNRSPASSSGCSKSDRSSSFARLPAPDILCAHRGSFARRLLPDSSPAAPSGPASSEPALLFGCELEHIADQQPGMVVRVILEGVGRRTCKDPTVMI